MAGAAVLDVNKYKKTAVAQTAAFVEGSNGLRLLRLSGGQTKRVTGVDASGMTKPTRAVASAATRIGGNVENDVIGAGSVARDPTDAYDMVQLEDVANTPRDE